MIKKKITIYLSEDEYKSVKKFSEKLGISFTGAGSIAIKLGIQAVNLASNPKMKKYFENEMEVITDELSTDRKRSI